MVQGDSITFEGQDLVACHNPNNSCEIRERRVRCTLYLGGYGCRAQGLDSTIPCKGGPIIFLPREKYLELRLMGEA